MIRARYYIGSQASTSAESAIDWARLLLATVARVLTNANVAGATLLPAIGLWHGAVEGAVVVEVLAGPELYEEVVMMAETIRAALDQDVVLWTLEPVRSGGARRA